MISTLQYVRWSIHLYFHSFDIHYCDIYLITIFFFFIVCIKVYMHVLEAHTIWFGKHVAFCLKNYVFIIYRFSTKTDSCILM